LLWSLLSFGGLFVFLGSSQSGLHIHSFSLAQDLLKMQIIEQFRGLAEAEKMIMADSIHQFRELFGHSISVGTICSGCEVFSHAQALTHAVWESFLGIKVSSQLEWIIEIDEWRRNFILEHFSPKRMFDNVVTLAQETNWTGHEYLSGEQSRVTRTHMIVAGFECDSVCGLNRHQADNRDCVALNQGKTGKTAAVFLLEYQSVISLI
jgi:hypothetical protein